MWQFRSGPRVFYVQITSKDSFMNESRGPRDISVRFDMGVWDVQEYLIIE